MTPFFKHSEQVQQRQNANRTFIITIICIADFNNLFLELHQIVLVLEKFVNFSRQFQKYYYHHVKALNFCDKIVDPLLKVQSSDFLVSEIKDIVD